MALELGEDAQHAEHRAPRRRRGVEALLVEVQVDALGVQLAEEADEVLEAAAQPVDRPCRDEVDVAPRD